MLTNMKRRGLDPRAPRYTNHLAGSKKRQGHRGFFPVKLKPGGAAGRSFGSLLFLYLLSWTLARLAGEQDPGRLLGKVE